MKQIHRAKYARWRRGLCFVRNDKTVKGSRLPRWGAACCAPTEKIGDCADLKRPLGEGFAEAVVGDVQLFGMDASLAGDGHEIGIAEPAREHMEMQMTGDAGSRSAAEIHAEVHAIGFV